MALNLNLRNWPWLKQGRSPLPPLQVHPDRSLRFLWNWSQLAILVLPLSMLLGGVSILLISLTMLWLKFRVMATQPLLWGFTGLSGVLLLSALLAHLPGAALLGLFNFIPYFWVFAAFSLLLQTPSQLRRLAWLIAIGSLPVTLIGLGQMLGLALGLRQVWHIQMFWVVIDWLIDFNGTPPGRMSATFGYANVLANYLVMTLGLSLGLWLEAVVQLGHPLQWPSRDRRAVWTTGLLTVTVALNAIALILTNSRNAWAIAAIVGLVYAVYLGWRWLAIGVMSGVGIILGAAFTPPPLQTWLRAIVPAFFWARLTDQMYPDRPVPTLRLTQWHFAWNLTQQRPWLGWGLRNFSELYQEATHFQLGHPHNLLLMLLCETGIPATVLLVGFVGWVILAGIRTLMQFEVGPGNFTHPLARDRHLLFIYVVTFLGNTLFNGFDITLFDARINILGWLLLAGIWGMVRYQPQPLPHFSHEAHEQSTSAS